MTSHVLIEKDGPITAIRLHRPEKKNAITVAMYQAMADALREAERDDAVRVVLFTATGDTFTAGNDLGDFMQNPPVGPESPVLQFLAAISTAKKPLVAAVDGNAVGVGLTMLLHCDLVYASERAVLRAPFVDLGLVPEAGSSLILPATLGRQQAFALLGLGEGFSAERAKEAGLIYAVVEEDRLEPAVMEAAELIASKPPEALKISRDLMLGPREPLLARMHEETNLFQQRLKSDEARAALMAFMTRKK
jgi:enoyl-CoA hydratase/carnithine racemase